MIQENIGKRFEAMKPGHSHEFLLSEADMDIQACVFEAVKTLAAPEELRPLQDNFDYDPVYREWGFDGYYFKGPKALVDPGVWIQKICGWLQVNYPDGPYWAMKQS
jgi:hypothetical protein